MTNNKPVPIHVYAEERAAKLILIKLLDADIKNEQWRDRMIREGHKV